MSRFSKFMGRLPSTRFERRMALVMTMLAGAIVLGTVWLGRSVLKETLDVGVNPAMERHLESELEIHRRYLVLLRSQAQQLAQTLAQELMPDLTQESSTAPNPSLPPDQPSTEMLAGHWARWSRQHPELAGVEWFTEDGLTFVQGTPRGQGTRSMTQLLPGTKARLVVHVFTKNAFESYREAGQLVQTYGDLRKNVDLVSGGFLRIFAWVISGLTLLALLAAIVLSRRLTRSVGELAHAAGRVGQGDLSVQVTQRSSDELGELTRAFNHMVKDIRNSRGRIEYLQRIGAWQEFARRLAHEIKNPLTPILLSAQEADVATQQGDPSAPHKVSEARQIIEEEVATLRRLVTEFSEFARLPKAQRVPTDLIEFLGDAVSYLGLDGRQAGPAHPVQVELIVEPGFNTVVVDLDAMLFKRALDNLVRNAIEAIQATFPPANAKNTEKETPQGRVTLHLFPTEDHVRLEITDNGPGIPEGQLETVFDPYFTTKATGTGLGLPITKKLILEHEGDIQFDNPPGGGARCSIRLPRLPNADLPRG